MYDGDVCVVASVHVGFYILVCSTVAREQKLTLSSSSAASEVYKRKVLVAQGREFRVFYFQSQQVVRMPFAIQAIKFTLATGDAGLKAVTVERGSVDYWRRRQAVRYGLIICSGAK